MRPDGQGARILIVDDEDDMREMVAAVLDADGYDLATAPDGESAIEAVGAAHFDLVLLDLRMPGMSGEETLAALRAVDPGLLVIVATGHATREQREACRALGAREVLAKPFSIVQLRSVIARTLQEHRDEGVSAGP